MRKKLIIAIIILVILNCLAACGIFFVLYTDNNNTVETSGETSNVVDTNTVVESNIGTNNNEFIEKYAQYLRDNVFESGSTSMNAVFLNIQNDENAIPVLAYKTDDYNLGFLSMNGDLVQKSNEYYEANIRMLYNVEDDQLNYFVEYNNEYYFVNDIVNQNSMINHFETDDDTMYYKYINLNKMVSMNQISIENLSQDLQNLYTTYQNTVVIDQNMQQTIDKEMKEISDSKLTATSKGISNAKYTAKYGTYVCGVDSFTINKDSSAKYKHDSVGTGYEYSNSYVLEHDIINFQNGNKKFKVIGNNQLQNVENNEIFNLKK